MLSGRECPDATRTRLGLNVAITTENPQTPVGAPSGRSLECRGAPMRQPEDALQRDVAVLSLRLIDPLGLERPERPDQLRAGLVGDDDIVDVSAFGRRV